MVPYRGTPQAVTDLVAGRADMMIDSQTLLAPLAQDGRVRALAVTTAHRSRLLPDLPTLAEAGVAGYAASSWQALQAPAGTPAPILARLGRSRRGIAGRAGRPGALCRGRDRAAERRPGRGGTLHPRRGGEMGADPAGDGSEGRMSRYSGLSCATLMTSA